MEKMPEKFEVEKLSLEGDLTDLVQDWAIELLENGEGLGLKIQ